MTTHALEVFELPKNNQVISSSGKSSIILP